MKGVILKFGLLAVLAYPAVANATQDADESALDKLGQTAPPVVIKQEPVGAAELRDAIRRIALRPSDTIALTDAGYAAIKLGDYDAAFNFFSKANLLQPADARIKAGLAIAQVRRENPFEALSLFDEAIKLGGNERSFALDRALAYDLLGNFERAEKDYALAKTWADSDELALRHAISISLSGRRDDADRLLIPMLQKENADAWRARALMLAARGDYKEAGKIAAGFLDEREARRMEGYFRNMPKLTNAQQAAAMHFGHFPVGANIGADSEQLVTLAASTGVKPVAQGDSRLIPTGEPLGTKQASVSAAKPKKPAAKGKKVKSAAGELATASAQQATNLATGSKVATLALGQLPVPEAARPPVRILLPALVPAFNAPAPTKVEPQPEKTTVAELPAVGSAVGPGGPATGSAATVQPVVLAQEPAVPVQASVEIKQEAVIPADVTKMPVQPSFESVEGPALTKAEVLAVPVADTALSQSASTKADLQPPVVATTDLAANDFDLGAVVGSIEVPDDEKLPSVAPVDLEKIKTVAPKPATVAAKADLPAKIVKAPVNVPRYFVQIATGADMTGLSFDYRRMAKKFGTLFAKQDGWTAAWGKTRRLLVGPFPDMKTAKKWEADLRKAGGDGFVWQSDKNSEVEKLKSK